MLGWMNHKPESRFLGEISIISATQMKAKSLLMKVKEESEKADLKLNQKPKIMAFWWLSW